MIFVDNIQLTKNFSTDELKCKHCGELTLDFNLVYGLQELRDWLGKPIIINSGYRCPTHNKAVGGSPTSQHIYGKAADIRSPGLNYLQLAEYAKQVKVFLDGGIGLYRSSGFVHVDVRGKRARW